MIKEYVLFYKRAYSFFLNFKSMKNNIKKVMLLFVILSCLCSCTDNNTINLSIEGLQADETKKIVFYNYKMQPLDSVEIQKNGTHKIKPKWEVPQIISLYERSKNRTQTFFSENKEITLEISIKSGTLDLPNMSIAYTSNSKNLKDFENYEKRMLEFADKRKVLNKQWAELIKKYTKKIPDDIRKPFDDAFSNYYKEKKKYLYDYVKKNNNVISQLLFLTDLRFALKTNTLRKILDDTPEKFKNTPYYKDLEKKYSILKNLSIGSVAPEIVHPDTLGNNLALSSLRGKYVLLDFWASWCSPCRKENPWVKKAYNRFHQKGFDVYAVSLDYQKYKNNWLKAIKQDKLPWHHVSVLKGWKDPAVETYNIRGIPSPFLLNPEGKIIAKGDSLREEKLIQTLEKIFNK